MSQVSCRVLGVAFDGLAARGIPAAELVAGLPYTEKQLRDSRRRIEWNVLVEIVERLECLIGSRQELERIGFENFWTTSYSNYRRLASFFATPRDLYWLGTTWFGPNLFGITNDRVEFLPDGRVLEVIEIPEPYAPCPGLFHIIAGALRATPSLLGMPEAEVELEIQPHRATFLITTPERSFSIRRALRSLLPTRSPRHFVNELAIQQNELRWTNQTLERTVRELRKTEARLTAILEIDSDVRYAIRIHADGRREQLWLAGDLESISCRPTSFDFEGSGWHVHPADRERFDARFEQVVEGDVLRLRYRIIDQQGNQRWIQESIRVESDNTANSPPEGGSAPAMVFNGTLKDVSAQARAELDRDKLISAVNQASDGIAVVGKDFEVVYANSALHRILENERKDLSGRFIGDGATTENGVEAIGSLIDQVLDKGTGHVRVEDTNAEGRLAILDAQAAVVYGEGRTVEGYVGIVRDVTREVEMEGQIRFAAQMNAIGQLAGGLAHDFSNLLMVIRADSDLLERRVQADSSSRQALARIAEAADQGEHLVQQLFTLSRLESDETELIDLNETVEDFVSFIRGVLAPAVRIEINLEDPLQCVFSGRGKLLQVLVNLAFNARDAMKERGVITIASGHDELGAERAAALEVAAGPYAWIEVRDTGHGMTPDVRARIFEPLFTTKGRGRGAGMGLSTVYRAMRDFGGAVGVESEPGRGSTFRLYFPVPTEAPDDTECRDGSGGRR